MGLLKSKKFRDSLYKRMKLTNPNSREYKVMCINLKTYNTPNNIILRPPLININLTSETHGKL